MIESSHSLEGMAVDGHEPDDVLDGVPKWKLAIALELIVLREGAVVVGSTATSSLMVSASALMVNRNCAKCFEE